MGGFGRSPFGRGPFGKSDTGFDLVIKLFPEEYFSSDLPPGTDPRNNDIDPLLKVLKTYANQVNQRRTEIDQIKTILDYEAAPLEILELLGAMLGLGIDKNDPEFLQRSFVGNASQWLQIKASTKGYEIRGLASGFSVEVDNFWRIDESYLSVIPARYLYQLKPARGDQRAKVIWHTDQPPGTFIGTPVAEDGSYAKSAYVRVVFQVADRREGVDYNKLLDLVIAKIHDVVGIHQELVAPQFLIKMDVNAHANVTMEIHEAIDEYDFNEFYRYDFIAGDAVTCDQEIVDVS